MQSPTPVKAYVPGRKPPGATRHAVAMSFTSSINTKALPTRCHSLPKALHRGARSYRSRSIAPELSDSLVREACILHRLPTTSAAYWQGWSKLRAKLGDRFRALFDAVTRVMAQTPRSSSLVENLNSRLRNYFTLRRHLGGSYLDLLRFFLNHRRFIRSQRAERTGRSPRC
jgi:hypothetical protein